MPKTVITPEAQDFIIKNRLLMSSQQLANKLGCSVCPIQRFLSKSGLSVPKEVWVGFRIAAMTGRTSFTPAQDIEIQKHYLTIPIKTLGERIGKSYTGIMCRIKQLGLSIPAEIIERNKQSARINKGNIPANKGKKMSPELYERVKRTMFKKGDVSANTMYDGAIVTRHNHKNRGSRPYNYIRVTKGKWELLHAHLWKQHNGPVPAGHIIIFKNGDTMNCSLDNLVCISREQHAANTRNSDGFIAKTMAAEKGGRGIYNKDLQQQLLKHPELIDLKRQSLNLKKEINERRK